MATNTEHQPRSGGADRKGERNADRPPNAKEATRVAVPFSSKRTRRELKNGSALAAPCDSNLAPPTSWNGHRRRCTRSDHEPGFRPEAERCRRLILTHVCEIARRNTDDTENPAIAGVAAVGHRTHGHPTTADRGDPRGGSSRRNGGRCLLDRCDPRSHQNCEPTESNST